jgi:predicted nucleic acid binding AN1-type Zn finger protein
MSPRCELEECRKKTIYMFDCRCKKNFCIKHRCPEEHECTFNYKVNTAQPKIESDKMKNRI